MKKILLFLLAIPVFMFVVFFASYEKTWECGVKITIGDMERNGGSIRVLNTKIEMPGTILDETYQSATVPAPFQFNTRGDGNYHFRYSDNVSKIVLWSGQTKMYEGPPVAIFKIGKGNLGIDLDAKGGALIEASNQFSIGSFARSFF